MNDHELAMILLQIYEPKGKINKLFKEAFLNKTVLTILKENKCYMSLGILQGFIEADGCSSCSEGE